MHILQAGKVVQYLQCFDSLISLVLIYTTLTFAFCCCISSYLAINTSRFGQMEEQTDGQSIFD